MDWTFPIVVALYTVSAFTFLWMFFYGVQRGLNYDATADIVPYRNLIFVHRALGFMLLGPLAAFLGYIFLSNPWPQTGIHFLRPEVTFFWGFGLVSLLLIFNQFAAKTKVNQQVYPQVRISRWTPSFFVVNAATWLLFLLGYEYLFRGLLFFPAVEIMGLWPAIGLNIVLYSLVHIPKGLHEILGALPFGIILCLAAYDTGSFWIAFIAHGSQAVINEFYAIRYNPAMDFGDQAEVLPQDEMRSDDSSD